MTLIAAVDVTPDTVLLLDGMPFFVDPNPEIDEYQEMVTHCLRPIDAHGFLEAPQKRCFRFEDRVALKG